MHNKNRTISDKADLNRRIGLWLCNVGDKFIAIDSHIGELLTDAVDFFTFIFYFSLKPRITRWSRLYKLSRHAVAIGFDIRCQTSTPPWQQINHTKARQKHIKTRIV